MRCVANGAKAPSPSLALAFALALAPIVISDPPSTLSEALGRRGLPPDRVYSETRVFQLETLRPAQHVWSCPFQVVIHPIYLQCAKSVAPRPLFDDDLGPWAQMTHGDAVLARFHLVHTLSGPRKQGSIKRKQGLSGGSVFSAYARSS